MGGAGSGADGRQTWCDRYDQRTPGGPAMASATRLLAPEQEHFEKRRILIPPEDNIMVGQLLERSYNPECRRSRHLVTFGSNGISLHSGSGF